MTALRLLYRARYLMLLVCGEDHPEMALLDVSYNYSNVIIMNNRNIENKQTKMSSSSSGLQYDMLFNYFKQHFYNSCIFSHII